MNLKAFIGAVRRHWMTFIVATVAVLTMGLTFIFLSAAKYVSSTQLLVTIDGSTTATAYQNDDVVAGRINSYIPLMTSGVVTNSVIDHLGLPLTTSELAAKISATRVPPKTAIIDLSVTDESPARAQLIAETLANEFVRYTEALETPTGEDSQKVHTTVVTMASEARGNHAERILLGVVAAITALLAGGVAVWVRARTDHPEARTADRAVAAEASVLRRAPNAPSTTPRGPVIFGQVSARLRSLADRMRGINDPVPVAQFQEVAKEQTASANAPADTRATATNTAGDKPASPTGPSTNHRPPNFRTWGAQLGRVLASTASANGRKPLHGEGIDKAGTKAPVSPGARRSIATTRRNHAVSNSITSAQVREQRPWLLAFLCFLIPALPAFVVPAGPLKSNGSPAKVIAVLLFGLAVLGFILVRRIAKPRTVQPGVVIVLVYFLLFLIVYGVGMTKLNNDDVQASATRTAILLVAQTGAALYILTRVDTTRQRTIVLGALAVGLGFACTVGLLQAYGIDIRYLFRPPGFILNTEGPENDALRFGVARTFGTSQHPIEFSVLAAMTVPLTIHFARYATDRQVRWLAALGCGIALLAMPAAVSRTGVISLVAALLVYMLNFRVREIAVAVVGGAAAVICYIVLFPGTANALWRTIISSEQDDSVAGRIVDYATVSQTFRAHPIFGIGLGASLPSEYGFLDNQWLQVLVQGGIIGAIALIILAGGGIFGISAALRSASTRRERDQAYMLGAMFMAVLASSFTFDLFSFQQTNLLFFILFGLLWSNFRIATPESDMLQPIVWARTARTDRTAPVNGHALCQDLLQHSVSRSPTLK